MIGDITVFGLTMGEHVLEDIGMNVPQGMVVTIPAEQALRSKDLWRSIAQKQIFRLHNGPMSSVVAPVQTDAASALIEQNQQLQKALEDSRMQNSAILAQNSAVLEQLRQQGEALKALTLSVGQGAVSYRPAQIGQISSGLPPESSTVSGDAPTYIPATIRPDGAEVRIESAKEETRGADIQSKRDKLRQFRR